MQERNLATSLGRVVPTNTNKDRNREAFSSVIHSYIENKTKTPICSSLANKQEGSRFVNKRWSVGSCLFVIDVEKAVTVALRDAALIRAFDRFFISPELDPEPAEYLSVKDREQRSDIEQRCGAEFIKRAIYPLAAYFRPTPHRREKGVAA